MIEKGTKVRVVYASISKPFTVIGMVNTVLLSKDKTTVKGYIINGAYISSNDIYSIEKV